MSQFAMMDGIEGILFRIGRWSKASEKNREDSGPGVSIYAWLQQQPISRQRASIFWTVRGDFGFKQARLVRTLPVQSWSWVEKFAE